MRVVLLVSRRTPSVAAGNHGRRRESSLSRTKAGAAAVLGELAANSDPAHRAPVHLADSIFRISRVLVLDEGESGRVAGNPHALESAKRFERSFQISLGPVGAQVSNVQPRTRHFHLLFLASKYLVGQAPYSSLAYNLIMRMRRREK